jgi:HSP20 family protein
VLLGTLATLASRLLTVLGMTMRYRRLSYRYTMVVPTGQSWPFQDVWESRRARFFAPARWRPDADLYETATTIEIVVDLAGVTEDDFEVQLFEDVLVVQGHRRLPGGPEGATYHAAAIRQGPFQVELALPARVDPERVEARHDRGLLLVTLHKRPRAT